MTKRAEKLKPLNIRIGKVAGLKVDADEFFADPEVQRKIALVRKMDLVGKKLNFQKPSPVKPD